ncbi:MAG: N-formylglutamate amidohydrolase [Alphaproteobacteria bacterium]|nr:N-formylglutamate amidohydrolase [Alphaproteobacteria bacterium]
MSETISLAVPTAPVVRRVDPDVEALPLVFDSPHSGTSYPDDFAPAAPIRLLRMAVDDHVDELFAEAPSHGAVLIAAEFPRVYIDPNRHHDDIDPDLLADGWPEPLQPSKKQKFGKSLIWRLIGRDSRIYDRGLTAAEVRHRIEHYWRPYHDCVQTALDEAYTRAGVVWHVNCHSMSARAGANQEDAGQERPDFTVSDLDGRSTHSEFLDCVVETLAQRGYEVRVNDPYQGMELIRRYSDPAVGRHSLQIEVKRSLYMTESTREKSADYEALQADLGRLCRSLADFARDGGG